jgi:hypothetical protein
LGEENRTAYYYYYLDSNNYLSRLVNASARCCLREGGRTRLSVYHSTCRIPLVSDRIAPGPPRTGIPDKNRYAEQTPGQVTIGEKIGTAFQNMYLSTIVSYSISIV